MGFKLNIRACADYAAWLANKGCSEDTFRTFKGVLVTGANATLDPNSAKSLLQQIKEGQYDAANKRFYWIPFAEVINVTGGDLRTANRADGFPVSMEENIPVVGASVPLDFKSIYIHKQLRKFNKKNLKFFAVTDTDLILGETDSTGLLKPVNGLLFKYQMLPTTTSGNGGSADVTLYYESAESLGDDLAFAALPTGTNLSKELQQIAELVMTADIATPLTAKVSLVLARGGENVTAELGAAIAAGGSISFYKTGETAPTAAVLAYDNDNNVITVTLAAAATGTLVLDDPAELIADSVGSIEEGTYSAEPIEVAIIAAP